MGTENQMSSQGMNIDDEIITLAQCRQKTEEAGHEPTYFNTTGRLSLVSTKNREGEKIPVMYEACQESRELNGRSIVCNKKVDSHGNCPACGSTEKTAFRWLPRAQFVDETDTLWLATFENEFTTIVGHNAGEAEKLFSNGMDQNTFFRQQYFGRHLKLRLKCNLEEYNS